MNERILMYTRAPWLFLVLLYIVTISLLWPGAVSPDAMGQYHAAVAGVYSDHHPPLMSFLWRHLDMIYKGSGLMFGLHVTLLYSACAIFIYIFRESKWKWWYAIYPIIPNMLAYTALIVKDTGFVYSYLLAGAIMSLLIVERRKKFKIPLLTICILLLFYGTCVKFQAKFLVIFFCLGIGYCLDYKFKLKNILAGLSLCAIILASMFGVNSYLVPNSQKAHTWQFVKYYDLTAISIDLDTPLYPKFVKENSRFNFAKIKEQFYPQEVDPLVFPEDRTLERGTTQSQRDELQKYWVKTVKDHPLLYLKNRLRLWSYNFTTSPSGRSSPVKYLQSTAIGSYVSIPAVAAFLDGGYELVNGLFKFIWIFPLLLIYFVLGAYKARVSRDAIPLLMFSISSLTLIFILLFFAMAATARYVFLCTCLVHASHGFAYRVLIKYRH